MFALPLGPAPLPDSWTLPCWTWWPDAPAGNTLCGLLKDACPPPSAGAGATGAAGANAGTGAGADAGAWAGARAGAGADAGARAGARAGAGAISVQRAVLRSAHSVSPS